MAMSTADMGTDASSLVVVPMTLPSDASIVPYTSTMAYSSIMPTTPSMLPTSSQPPPSGMYHGQPVTYDGQSYKLLQVDVSIFVAIKAEDWNDSYQSQGNYPWKSDSSSNGYQSESSTPWKFGSSSRGHHTHWQQSRGLNSACQSTLSCSDKSSNEHDIDLFEVSPAYFRSLAKAATNANQDLLQYANQHPIFIANLGTST